MATMTTRAAMIATALIGYVAIQFGHPWSLLATTFLIGVWLLWLFDRKATMATDQRAEPPRSTLTTPAIGHLPIAPTATAHEMPKARTAITVDLNEPAVALRHAGGAPQITEGGRLKSEPQRDASISMGRVISAKTVAHVQLPNAPQMIAPGKLRASGSPRIASGGRHLPADHFERHRGVPGHLYAAWNEQLRGDLYKLGYTVQHSVCDRMTTLNGELAGSAHAGQFTAVHSVAVTSAYDGEQALFALLARYRIADGREFFMVPRAFLVRAMDRTAAAFAAGGSHVADDSLCDLPPAPEHLELVRRGAFRAYTWPTGLASGGWVVVLRNEAYKPDIHRLGFTATSLDDYKRRLDYGQRSRTAGIGFFAIVAAWPDQNPRQVVEALLRQQRSHRIGKSNFVNMPLAALSSVVELALGTDSNPGPCPARQISTTVFTRDRQSTEQPNSRIPDVNGRAATVSPGRSAGDVVRRSAARAKRPTRNEPSFENTCPYSECRATIRATWAFGDIGEVFWGRCRHFVGFEIGATGLDVWREAL